jgi:hypothetical protein
MVKPLLVTLLFSLSSVLVAQTTTYDATNFSVERTGRFNPKTLSPDFNVSLKNIEAPNPNGDSYKDFLLRQKMEAKKRFPRQHTRQSASQYKTSGVQPQVGRGFPITQSLFDGRVLNVYAGGIPNDDALAVSNDGIVLAGINSAIYAYDTNTDTTLFEEHVVSLGSIGLGAGVGGGNFYDPKLLYDEIADRFILVFLKDNDSINSRIIIAFSSTNNPTDPWNVYALPGNPLNSGRWTDFPAINITNDELFITGNLIVPGVSWQVGFDGSVIWQVNKEAGYNNAATLGARLYSNIRFGGRYIRNLHCVQGTTSATAEQYFMSNRNFDVSNDTVFLLNIAGTADDPSTELKINYGLATPNYGVPPNARQTDTDTSNAASGLQTNDGRVLGALTNGDWIQYVSTTMNPATGLAAIYHGRIETPGDFSQPFVADGTILGDDSLDFGYPNLAFTGNEACDDEVLIGFNCASPEKFPGYGFIYKENHGGFLPFQKVVEGQTYTDRQNGSAERWGDYFGIQRKYNQPGRVWMSGYFTYDQGTRGINATWISEVTTQDSLQLDVVITPSGNTDFGNGYLNFTPYGSIPPYTILVNGDTLDGFSYGGVTSGDTLVVEVSDGYGCVYTKTIIAEKSANSQAGIFPNPAQTSVISQFTVPQNGEIIAVIADMRGNTVHKLVEANASKGLTELQFQLSPLRAGRYVLKVFQNEEVIYTESFVKVNY